MKKIIKTKLVKVPIVTEYYSDFKPKKIIAGTTLTIQGGYHSNIDLLKYTFDMDDETTEEILKFIESKLAKGKTRKDFEEDLFGFE